MRYGRATVNPPRITLGGELDTSLISIRLFCYSKGAQGRDTHPQVLGPRSGKHVTHFYRKGAPDRGPFTHIPKTWGHAPVSMILIFFFCFNYTNVSRPHNNEFNSNQRRHPRHRPHAYVSIRQHTSEHVSIRQHTSTTISVAILVLLPVI